jgi:hypothetical protein
MSARNVLDDLLVRSRTDFAKEFPKGVELNWYETSIGHLCLLSHVLHDYRTNTEVYGHESATKFHSLDTNFRNGTVEQFADNVALLTGKSAATKRVEVRFVYKSEVIVSLDVLVLLYLLFTSTLHSHSLLRPMQRT